MFFRRLVAREAGAQLRSWRFRIGTALAVTLALLTVAIRLDDYRSRVADAELRQHFVDQARHDARGVLITPVNRTAAPVDPQLRTVRRPPPGIVLMSGVDGAVPTYWDFSGWTTIHGAPPTTTSQGSHVGSMFDLELIVRLLLGLLAIGAGLSAVTANRADGTLAALLSQPVRRRHVATALLIGTVLPLVSCVIAVLLAVGLLLWESGLLTPAMLASVTTFGGCACVYVATMAAIGMVIGSRARTEAAGVTMAMTTWGLLTLVAPEFIAAVPRVVTAVPGRAALEQALRDEYTRNYWRIQREMGLALIARVPDFEWPRGANVPADIAAPINELCRQAIAALRADVNGAEAPWTRARATAEAATEWLARLDPATAFLQSAMAATDTGYSLRERWDESTTRFERRFQAVVFDADYRFTIVLPSLAVGHLVPGLPALHVADVGEVSVPETVWRDRMIRARWDLSAIVLFLIGASIWAVAVFPRPGFRDR